MPDLTRVLTKLNQMGYTDATVVVGADQVNALGYVKNYNGKPDKSGNIPFTFNTLNVISRQETNDPSRDQEGPRATPMRAVLMDPTKSEEEKFEVWRDAMNSELSDEEVMDLMHKAEQRMRAMVKPKKKGVAEGEQDPQSELKLINQKLKDAYKHVRNNSSVSIGWYMSQVKELKARREELIKQLKQGVAEGNEWQGNRGNSQAGITDHTFDEAKQYIKGNYPFHKTYNVSRVEPGMRYHANPEKVANKTQSLVKGIDSALDYLQVKQNPMMSGSTQVTPSIGYSWHTHESRANGIAVLYYEDRGMGNDTITIAAKDRNNLKGAVQVCRDAGVIPLPKVKEQGVAEGQTPEQEIERLKLRQNAEHGSASLKRQSETQARIRELEKQIKDKEGIAEAPGDFGLGANYRSIPDDEMQDFMDRSKTKKKTKRDKFDYPYVHGSNIEVKDEAGKKYNTEALKSAIMQRPKSILGQNAKMQHSETGTEAVYDIGLPALKGLAVNENTGEFVIVDTCPGAGACKTYCYAMKGSYVMFKAVSLGLSRMLNFLLNDPEGFAAKLNDEIAEAKLKNAKKGAKTVVRWHDAGDFFSEQYLDMAYSVANANPGVSFYAYTKMGDVANASRPKNFNMNFSQGASSEQEKKVDIVRTKHSKVVPKDMFFDLIDRDGNNLNKDSKGRMQFASPEKRKEFKIRLAHKYTIDPTTILTYDEMMALPIGSKPKWNVIVMPGDGDNSANRNDVVGSYLLFH